MLKSGFFTRSRGNMGESIEVEDSLELEYDMWDGQFDFVGPQDPAVRGRITSDNSVTEDLFTGTPLTPHLSNGLNGGKKTAAHQWCDNLSDQVQLLQQQVTSLADTQSTADERYARAKADNAVLQARVHMLDEQIREIECRCEERIAEEQRRCRDAISRVERERDAQLGAAADRLAVAEEEASHLRQEVGRLRGVAETLRSSGEAGSLACRSAQEAAAELAAQLAAAREEARREREGAERARGELRRAKGELDGLRGELDGLRGGPPAPPDPRLHELARELELLRTQNKCLAESQEELQAQLLTRGVEAGRSLLQGVGLAAGGASLASELAQMSDQELVGSTHTDRIELDKLQKALKEQQDVNVQLRNYIDGILLSIVENYPQLLEVKYQKPDTKS